MSVYGSCCITQSPIVCTYPTYQSICHQLIRLNAPPSPAKRPWNHSFLCPEQPAHPQIKRLVNAVQIAAKFGECGLARSFLPLPLPLPLLQCNQSAQQAAHDQQQRRWVRHIHTLRAKFRRHTVYRPHASACMGGVRVCDGVGRRERLQVSTVHTHI